MCVHLKQTLEEGMWRCRMCNAIVPKTKEGIREIVESGIAPQADVEPIESSFSFSLGKVVHNRRDFREKEAAITDPERNPEHVLRKTPKERQAYFDRCLETGEVP